VTKHWLALAVFAAAVALLLFGILRVISYASAKDLSDYSVNMATPNECVLQIEDREKIRQMSLEAFDHAFEQYAIQLYRHAWLKTRAFGRAYNPPLCKEK
jgi:hypothetical protein